MEVERERESTSKRKRGRENRGKGGKRLTERKKKKKRKERVPGELLSPYGKECKLPVCLKLQEERMRERVSRTKWAQTPAG